VKPVARIIAATDFSADADRAASRASRIAVEQGASLELVHVVNRRELDAAGRLDGLDAAFEARLLQNAEDRLAALAQRLEGGDRIQTSVKVGDPRTTLQEAAEAADLLVLGARGAHPLRDMLLGTTAERLVSRAPTPLLVVKGPDEDAYRRVLAAVDLSPASMAVVEAAARIAAQATVTVAHAFCVPFERHLHLAGASEEKVAAYRARARDESSAQIERLLAGSDRSRWLGVVEHGDPAPMILDLQRRQRMDLVVVAKNPRSALTDSLLGSVTRTVLAAAECDVLVVPGA
jgi:nucleotide-binding universal stress UspA family protein